LYEKENKIKWDVFSINRTPTLMGVPVFKTPHITTMKEKICRIIMPDPYNKKSEQVFSTV
jgi:hypothetical protein